MGIGDEDMGAWWGGMNGWMDIWCNLRRAGVVSLVAWA